MKVEWSAFAMEDRDRIFDYIESESSKAAVRVDGCIEEQANQLAQFPEFGRPGRVDGTRELVISHRVDPLKACDHPLVKLLIGVWPYRSVGAAPLGSLCHVDGFYRWPLGCPGFRRGCCARPLAG